MKRPRLQPALAHSPLLLLALATLGCGPTGSGTPDPAAPPQVRALKVLGCELGLRAEFVADVDPQTVGAEAFTVEGIPGTVGYDAAGRAVTFRPAEPFVSGETHTAVLSTVLRSSGGTPLSEPLRWQFACIDRTPPAVIGRHPLGEDVSTLVRPTIQFSEAMDETTLVRANLRIDQVDAFPSWDASTRTVTLSPRRPLYPGRRYTVVVSRSVRDRAGNPLGADVTWTFRTRAPIDDWAARVVTPALPAHAPCDSPVEVRMAPAFELDLSSLTATPPPIELEGAAEARLEHEPGARILRLVGVLLPGETYRVVATETFRDRTQERPFDPGAELSEIRVVEDCRVPTVAAVEDAWSTVACTGEVRVRFSVPMDPELTTPAISLRDLVLGGYDPQRAPVVDAQVELSEDGLLATLTPSAPLVSGRRYWLEVRDTAVALEGEPLVAGGGWELTARCP